MKPGDKVKLSHPTPTDPAGSHPYFIKDEDYCHYYVRDLLDLDVNYKVRKDACVPWRGYRYEE